MKRIYNISILGGTDGFGKWLTEYILKHFGEYVQITITGKNIDKGKKLESELPVTFISDNIEAVSTADVVIYSVPIASTAAVIEDTLPHIPSGAVVADVTSIKKFPSALLKSRDDIIAIPTHPMFGPHLSTIAGQAFVLTADESVRETQEYKFLYNFLKTEQARVRECSAKYHDKMMAVVQGLTHSNMFVIGETMKRLNFDIAESMDFISPIYKLLISSVGRFLIHNPKLYADIQIHNDEILEVHKKFLETAQNFHDSVASQDSDKFCRDAYEARDFLGNASCQEGSDYTDKIIYMIGKQIDTVNQNIGKNILLKNIYTEAQVSGTVEKYEKGKIFLSNGEVYSIDQYEVINNN